MPEDVYTHGHQPSVVRSHSWRNVENSAPHLLSRLRPGLSVLDVGCGPGSITVDLAARVAPGPVVGIDRSAEVVAIAAESAGGAENVTFAVGDVYALDADDDSFDVVHAHQVLQHLSDPVAALVEMRRVCRPDGVVAIRDADYGAFRWWPEDERLSRWLDTYRRVAQGNGAEPDAGRQLKAWALAAGFTSVQASASVWCFASDDERAWWGGQWAERVIESDLAGQAVEAGIATVADLEEMAAGFRAWAQEPAGWFSVLQGEILATP